MTWLQFKTAVEKQGVKDDDTIGVMDWDDNSLPDVQWGTEDDGTRYAVIECGDDIDPDEEP